MLGHNQDQDQDREGSRQEFLQLLAEQGEEPAFVVRRRRLDAALEQLRWTCRTQRMTLLHGPRLHLRKIASVVREDWSQLSRYLVSTGKWRVFQSLHEDWNRDTPPPPWANRGNWGARIEPPLRAFKTSVERFNRHWNEYLDAVDLSPINRKIEGHNQYYVIEKACAFGSELIARRGFQPVERLTVEMLRFEFPPIDLPAIR